MICFLDDSALRVTRKQSHFERKLRLDNLNGEDEVDPLSLSLQTATLESPRAKKVQ